MAMTTTGADGGLQKFARFGGGVVLAAGAAAFIVYARSEQGKQKMTELFGAQFGNIEEQLQIAIRENMPLIEEAVDKLVETLLQGVASLTDEINRLGGETKSRISTYADTLPAQAGQ